MEFAFTTLFRRSYATLKPKEQGRIDRAAARLMDHPFHPFPKGLRVHKLNGRTGTPTKAGDPPPDVWEMHASGALLITFQYGPVELLFRNCGFHADVLRNP